jgi:hypothetical protein
MEFAALAISWKEWSYPHTEKRSSTWRVPFLKGFGGMIWWYSTHHGNH